MCNQQCVYVKCEVGLVCDIIPKGMIDKPSRIGSFLTDPMRCVNLVLVFVEFCSKFYHSLLSYLYDVT